MKTSSLFNQYFGVSLLLFGMVLVGCSTARPVDWNARVGNYTYDQAVMEMGQPTRTAKLNDGKLLAEWITPSRPPETTVNIAHGTFGSHDTTQIPSQNTQPRLGKAGVRLIFGPDNRLVLWSGIR